MEISLNKKDCLIDNNPVLRDYIDIKINEAKLSLPLESSIETSEYLKNIQDFQKNFDGKISLSADMVENGTNDHAEESSDFLIEERVLMPLLHKNTLLEFKDSHNNTLFQGLNTYDLKSFTYPPLVNGKTGNNGYVDILFIVDSYGNYIKDFLNNYEKIDSVVYTLRKTPKYNFQDVIKIILHNAKVEYLTFEANDDMNSIINCVVTIKYDKASYI